MAFSSSFYIAENETRNGKEGYLSDMFKKYQILRMGALFGMKTDLRGDKIYMHSVVGKTPVQIYVGNERMIDLFYKSNLDTLKSVFNQTYAKCMEKGLSTNRVKPYAFSEDMATVPATEAYPEDDPVFYMGRLVAEMNKKNKNSGKALAGNTVEQMNNLIHSLEQTSWGSKSLTGIPEETLANAMISTWENNARFFGIKEDSDEMLV